MNQETRPRNRRGEGGLLRDEILRAALELLDETGDARAVTLRAVARGAGISAPSIYPHFRSPETILLAVARQEFAGLHEHLRAAEAAAGRGAGQRLRAWCSGYLAFARERPQRYLLMFGGVWNARPAVDEAVISGEDVTGLGGPLLADLARLVAAWTGREAADGTATTDAMTDAIVVWVGLHGLAHQRIVSQVFDWPPDVDDRLIGRLLAV